MYAHEHAQLSVCMCVYMSACFRESVAERFAHEPCAYEPYLKRACVCE